MFVHKNQVLTEQSGFVKGYFPSNEKLESVETLPAPVWTGQRMPYHTWQQIVSFFREVYKLHKAEATVRLFYNPKDGSWTVGVMTQTVSGASAKEEGDPLAIAGIEIGTIHSHASMAAFQSGTDHNDERAGFHITIGKLGDAVLDIHSRYVRDGLQYPVVMSDWVEIPEMAPLPGIAENVMKELNAVLFKNYMNSPADVAIPPEWIGKVKTYSYVSSAVGTHGYRLENGVYKPIGQSGNNHAWAGWDGYGMRKSVPMKDPVKVGSARDTTPERLTTDAAWELAWKDLEGLVKAILYTAELSDLENHTYDAMRTFTDMEALINDVHDDIETAFEAEREKRDTALADAEIAAGVVDTSSEF